MTVRIGLVQEQAHGLELDRVAARRGHSISLNEYVPRTGIRPGDGHPPRIRKPVMVRPCWKVSVPRAQFESDGPIECEDQVLSGGDPEAEILIDLA